MYLMTKYLIQCILIYRCITLCNNSREQCTGIVVNALFLAAEQSPVMLLRN